MNTERLLRLADYMERVDPRNYNQSTWLDGTEEDVCPAPTEFDPGRLVIREGACGTTMCVLGHAVAAIPDAKLWFSGSVAWAVVQYRDPNTGEIFDGMEAARHVFDLPEGHAVVLFGADDDPVTYAFYTGQAYNYDKGENDFHDLVTPTTVAQTLRQYVETDGRTAVEALKTVADLEKEW
jgi:hypothetical protein